MLSQLLLSKQQPAQQPAAEVGASRPRQRAAHGSCGRERPRAWAAAVVAHRREVAADESGASSQLQQVGQKERKRRHVKGGQTKNGAEGRRQAVGRPHSEHVRRWVLTAAGARRSLLQKVHFVSTKSSPDAAAGLVFSQGGSLPLLRSIQDFLAAARLPRRSWPSAEGGRETKK